MKGRNPSKEEKAYMDKVQQLGCIVCANRGFPDVPAEIHHTRGKTVKDAHLYVLPLCPSHHRFGGHIEPISRHPYKKRFEDAYGTEAELLECVGKILAGEKNIYQSQVLSASKPPTKFRDGGSLNEKILTNIRKNLGMEE
tara:strand:+ start:1153 stop:1572 length:420 start_codon:yes stop_codon:yes gene_type:complete